MSWQLVMRGSATNLRRAPVKTALYFFMHLLTIILIAVSVYIWANVNIFLKSCDENYTTIGVFEYIAGDYPNEKALDQAVVDAGAALDGLGFAGNRAVLSWDNCSRAIGYLPGYTKYDDSAYLKNRAVIVIGSPRRISSGLYNCVIEKTVYSYQDNTGCMICLDDGMKYSFESNRYYLVSGEFYSGNTGGIYFATSAYDSVAMRAAGEKDPVFIDITDPSSPDGFTIPQGVMTEIGKTTDVINNSLNVFSTNDVEATLPFQQEQVAITKGRVFTKDEYDQHAQVCIVSENLARCMKLDIGDSVPISLIHSGDTLWCESYWNSNGFDWGAEYTVVGIMRSDKSMSSYVYVPNSDNSVFSGNKIGYTLGIATLDNRSAEQFYTEVYPLLPAGVKLTVWDQGYAAATAPFRTIKFTADIVLAICVLFGACMLSLFGYLFVFRQREIAEIMHRLGAERKTIYRHFLYGTGIIGGAAVAAGTVCAFLLSGKINDFVIKIAATIPLPDTRYSDAAASLVKAIPTLQFGHTELFLITALATLAAALGICALFLRVVLSRGHRYRKPEKVGGPAARVRMNGYGFLSAIRGRSRTAITLAAALAAAMLFGDLAVSADSYRSQLDEIKQNTVIKAAATNISGQISGGLVIPAKLAEKLLDSGYVGTMSVSNMEKYLFECVTMSDGVELEIHNVDIPPSGTFARETFLAKAFAKTTLVYTNDVEGVPEFFYSAPNIVYLDGYGPEMMDMVYKPGDVVPCVVSNDFLAEHGVKLGDTVLIMPYIGNIPIEKQYLVAGSFSKVGRVDNFYCPMSSKPASTNRFDPVRSFDSMSFTLSDTSKLGEFKDYLQDNGFSHHEKIVTNRIFITVDDRAYLSTVSTLSFQTSYVDSFYPAIYAFCYLAGLAGAYMLAVSRKRELATMRALGDVPRRISGIFMGEQAWLCLIGAVLGIIIEAALGNFSSTGLLLSGGYVLLWLAGYAVSLSGMFRMTVLSILHKEE